MWNDPDLDSRRNQSSASASAARNHRARPSHEDIIAFGYESFLFGSDGIAEAIEQGQLLITWQGQDPADENALWLDRYDVRNLLDDDRLFSGPRDIYDTQLLSEGADLQQERFEDLDSDEELLFDMDEDERKEHLERKREDNEYDYKGVHYEYGEHGHVNAQEPTYRLHFDVPEGMAVPDSEKTLALIERTAKFVNNSSEPTMEIILQAKQATNPNFAFMSRRHQLFQFYKHVRWLMQTGLYESAEEARQREAEDAKAEQDEEAKRTANDVESDHKQTIAIHVDVKAVLEATVELLNAHEGTLAFEEKILSLRDPRFGFLKSDHPWHRYYIRKRDEDRNLRRDQNGQSDATLSESISASVSKMEDQEHGESSAGERQRQDRLQRVKALLQKHKAGVSDDGSPSSVAEREESESSRSGSTSRRRSESGSPSRSRSRSSSGSDSVSPTSTKRVRI
ncbi:hypothetical protein BGZ75_006471 [Mortierella antarctica]|nr:hypothetical protein BGZ75_006471 [Mortierella antarctica]